MAYVINDECISCGSCEGECPVSAISQGDAHYEINADTCYGIHGILVGIPDLDDAAQLLLEHDARSFLNWSICI